jgi:translation initiation factor IF-3
MGKNRGRESALPAGDVWLFDQDGADLGFVSAPDAAARAASLGLDLVRLDQSSSPPRYGLRNAAVHAHDAARLARIARGGEPKEVRIRVVAGAADTETRRRSAESLLQAGHRVKLRVELEAGRRANPAPARAMLDTLVKSLAGVGTPEAKPQPEKGAVAVTLAPIS